MSVIIPSTVVLQSPRDLPPETNIVVIHEGPQSDRSGLLARFQDGTYSHVSLSALYIAPTLDEARDIALSDNWT